MRCPALSGHAGDPGTTVLTVIIDALHVAAAAVWVGGLAQLVWVTPQATRGLTGQEQKDARTAIVSRFSTIALGAVVVLAVTGGARALWSVDAVSQIWSTSYGRVLVLKTVLLLVLVWLGYRNRHQLSEFSKIHRRGWVELGVMAALVVAVTVLTNLPPANVPAYSATASAPPPAGGPATLALEGGGRLSIWPGTAGVNMVSVNSPGAEPGLVTVSVRSADGANTATRLSRFGDTQAGVLATVGPGQAIVTVTQSGHKATTTIAIGPAPTSPIYPPAPKRVGAVAAEEAGDLAVGLQREGDRRAQVTLIASAGTGVARALILVNGHGSQPCPGKAGCYTAAVPSAAATLAVKVIRPGGRTVAATLQLPAADAPAETRARGQGRPRIPRPGQRPVREHARLESHGAGGLDVRQPGSGSRGHPRARRPKPGRDREHRVDPAGRRLVAEAVARPRRRHPCARPVLGAARHGRARRRILRAICRWSRWCGRARERPRRRCSSGCGSTPQRCSYITCG